MQIKEENQAKARELERTDKEAAKKAEKKARAAEKKASAAKASAAAEDKEEEEGEKMGKGAAADAVDLAGEDEAAGAGAGAGAAMAEEVSCCREPVGPHHGMRAGSMQEGVLIVEPVPACNFPHQIGPMQRPSACSVVKPFCNHVTLAPGLDVYDFLARRAG